MTNEKRRRGKQKAPTLVHINLRLPHHVVAHFQTSPNYTKEIRRVLTEYVDNLEILGCGEENGDR